MNMVIGLSLIVLFTFGVPIAISIVLASIIGIEFFTRLPLLLVPQQMFIGIDKFPLMAIPFFILAGNLMAAGGISQRLVDLAKSIVGRVQGGLAMSCVLTCMMFAAVSGSSVATTFAIGAILIPAMVKHGYPKPLAASIQASSAELGVLIPPSIPLILYGIVTETSISRLFISGIVPGLLIGAALMVTTYILANKQGGGVRQFRWDVLWKAFKDAWLALVLPVIVIGGIIGGVFTATEAAVAALLYSLAISLLVYREFKLSELMGMLIRTARLTGMVMMLLAFATVIAWFLTINMVPQTLVRQVQAITQEPFLLLLIVAALLLLVGFVMDLTPAMVIMAPMLAPIVTSVGVDAAYFGVLMAFILGIGLLTPPVGTCLYVGCGVGKVSMESLVKAMLPYYAALLVVLVLLIAFPSIVTWLPDLTAVRGN